MSICFKTFLVVLLSVSVLSIIILPLQIDAQSPQQRQPNQEQMMQMMGPMMGTMMETMIETGIPPV